jgi:hypothetical protein
MSEWIYIEILTPQNNQQVEIKIYDRKTKKEYHLKAKFIDSDLYRSWEFKMPEGTDIVHLPTHWRVI